MQVMPKKFKQFAVTLICIKVSISFSIALGVLWASSEVLANCLVTSSTSDPIRLAVQREGAWGAGTAGVSDGHGSCEAYWTFTPPNGLDFHKKWQEPLGWSWGLNCARKVEGKKCQAILIEMFLVEHAFWDLENLAKIAKNWTQWSQRHR